MMEENAKEDPVDPFADITVEDISSYYQEMVRSSLVELEIETPKGKIVLKRYQEKEKPAVFFRRKTDFLPRTEESAAPTNVKVVVSPITGTFYRSSSPQSSPYVKEGDIINPGATVCIVEAMKVMNEIKTEFGGRVTKILGENGKPCTKGQALFHIEPQ